MFLKRKIMCAFSPCLMAVLTAYQVMTCTAMAASAQDPQNNGSAAALNEAEDEAKPPPLRQAIRDLQGHENPAAAAQPSEATGTAPDAAADEKKATSTGGAINSSEEEEEEEPDEDEIARRKAEAARQKAIRTGIPASPFESKLDKRIEDVPTGARPEDPHVFLARAKKLTELGAYAEAFVELNKALEHNPRFWEARYLGAYIYQMQGRLKEAIPGFRQFLQVYPEHVQARVNLGMCLKKAGELSEAEAEYKKAIDLKYFSLEAHYNLANLLIEQNRLEEALKELRACEKISPTNAWVHNNLGVIYHRRHYLEEAEEEFLRALNLEPANKTFENNLEMVRRQLRKKPVRA